MTSSGSREAEMLLIRLSGRFPPALVGHGDGQKERPRGDRLPAVLPLLLLSGLVVIIPLAYAGPPDPTWIPGIYDNADYDDVVGFVTDGTAASSGQPPARVAQGVETGAVLPGPGQVPSRILCVAMNRGPPPIPCDHHPRPSPTVSLHLVDVAPPHGVLRSRQPHGSPMFDCPSAPVRSRVSVRSARRATRELGDSSVREAHGDSALGGRGARERVARRQESSFQHNEVAMSPREYGSNSLLLSPLTVAWAASPAVSHLMA